MVIDFKQYTIDIKEKIKEIPNANMLFWGAWICERIFLKYASSFDDFLEKKQINVLNEIREYLWEIVDNPSLSDSNKLKLLLGKLQKIDESDLDTTQEVECAIYELIISLDAILSGILATKNAWAYNLSQSPVNIIDTILSENDFDILSEEGANSPLFQNEVSDQYKVIDFLKSTIPAQSKDKDKFIK